MKPEFTGPWAYKRMILGGIWMLFLILPIMKNKIILRGMLMGLIPSAMMLFQVSPSMGKGLYGLGSGNLMPAVVIGLNFIYGAFASYWYAQATQ